MASRMDRYYKNELINSGRSTKNKSLYKQIEDLDNYTNIEGVATIEKTNEIDISKVKEMLQNRENYKKQRQLINILQKKEVEEETLDKEEIEETKNYDIKDILSKAKEESNYIQENRSLTEEQYNVLKNLNLRGKRYSAEKDESQDSISASNNNELTNDDSGLLDELKSNTMVGDASSIRKILEEEKQNHIDENTGTIDIDKSFYTSSFGFTRKDFDELRDMNHKIKKGNKFIIILLVVVISLIILSGLLLILLN